MVRAKFKVTKISQTSSQHSVNSKLDYCQIVMSAVAGAGNETWSKWTPQGELSISITNPAASEQFKIGDYIFIDFSPAPPSEADEHK